jgi:hypothetical protein
MAAAMAANAGLGGSDASMALISQTRSTVSSHSFSGIADMMDGMEWYVARRLYYATRPNMARLMTVSTQKRRCRIIANTKSATVVIAKSRLKA